MFDKGRTHHAVAKLATDQHGVVSIRQLVDLGFSRANISSEVARGRLHRVHRGVYGVGHTNIPHLGQCLAAILCCGDGAVLSHRSAAWLWGLTRRWGLPIEVTTKTPRRTRAGIRMHSALTLAPDDMESSEGIPVTAVPRTLLDFAAVDPRFLGRALDNAERLGLLDLPAIEMLLARSNGLRGVARLREAMGLYRLPGLTRSGLERRFLGMVHDAGLSLPAMNLFIAGYEVDAYWPAERFAVELDTYDYHGGHSAFENDRMRQEDLKLAGIEMTRITGLRIEKGPKAVANRLRRLLDQRRRDLGISAPK
jgi:Transcriptional regulator, AbiEi antitoxin